MLKQFRMEKGIAILLLVLLGAVRVQSNYLDGLRVLKIDPLLIDQANSAINDLKNALYQNFQCQQQQPRQQEREGSWNLRSHRLLEEEHHFRFRGARGGDGFFSRAPQVLCQDKQQSRVFFGLYQKVLRVSQLLNKVKSYIMQYNNIILGNGNAVNGSSNVVIGSRNSLTGNNDWVFASDYHSSNPEEGVLIIDVYLIELSDMLQITYNPREVIHCLKKEDSNQHFRNFWNREHQWRRAAF